MKCELEKQIVLKDGREINGRYKTATELANFLLCQTKSFNDLVKRYNSIFHTISARYYGYSFLLTSKNKTFTVLKFFNIDKHNILLKLDSKAIDCFSQAACWQSSNNRISIEHEWLMHWLLDVSWVLETKDLMRAKVCSLRYKNRVPDIFWMQLCNGADNKEFWRFIRNDFK